MTVKRVTSDAGKHLLEAIKKLEDKSVKVGWIHSQYYIDSRESVAAIAAQNEFGNPKKHIPARPFMRPTIAAKQNEWRLTAENGAKKVLSGKLSIDKVLDLIGFQAEGDIKKTIKQLYSPALSETTILARIGRNARLSSIKGRLKEKSIGNITKPLIDTGIMFNTLTHEVS